jgi:GT2 family glycosyltransferase
MSGAHLAREESDRPEVSVLLTSWNTREQTRACLTSLHRVAAGLDYEVIAVDNGSRDGSADVLAADPRVRLIRNPTNLGFAAAVNQAHRVARGELLLILNSDVRFHDHSLAILVEFLRRHPAAAGASPQYRNPDGSFQQHYIQLPTFAASLTLFTALRRVPGFAAARARYDLVDVDFSVPQPLASASCLLLRASVVGGRVFDEEFPIFWNDVLLTRELQAAGHRLWMLPTAVVTHSRGASCVLLGSRARFRHLLGGLVRYLGRTQPAYRVQVFRLVMIMNYLARTVAGRSTPLGWFDLWAALRGDLGPLPDGDTRPWDVVLADTELPPDPDRRRLVVELGARPQRGGLQVQVEGPSHWRATIGSAVPYAGRSGLLRRLNLRIAAARIRSWLDGQAGPRTLYVDPDQLPLARWLGEDVALGPVPDVRSRQQVAR